MIVKKIGRPTKFTEQLGDAICHGMADGKSLSTVCKELEVASSTVFRWLREEGEAFEAFSLNYARAREAQGQFYGHRVAEIAADCLAGKVDPQAARVAVDALKWTAARMAPKQWGDRVELHQTGESKHSVTIKLVRDVPAPKRPIPRLLGDPKSMIGQKEQARLRGPSEA